MKHVSIRTVLGLGLVLMGAPALWAGAELKISGEYLGQDGHDYVPKAPVVAANDVQDLHLRLSGLPKGDEIASASFKRQGGGEWAYNGPWGPWKAYIIREAGATTADVFLEPSHNEQAFNLNIHLVFKSGASAELNLGCGKSDSQLLMPNVGIKAKWLGQDGHDMTGPGPSVGPDGIQDVRLQLSGLGTKSEIKDLAITGPDGLAWEYGLNPQGHFNAELVLNDKDKSHGMLLLSPDRDLAGQALTLTVHYANGITDHTTVTAQQTDPHKAMPKPAPVKLAWTNFAAHWLGQDGMDVNGRGDVHVSVAGVPAGRKVVVAALANTGGGYWVWKADAKADFYVPPAGEEIYATLPMTARAAAEGQLDLFFQPFRAESHSTLTLRLVLDDGSTIAGQFPGGACDPFLRGPLPSKQAVTAKPGDDLQALANEYGQVTLSAGTYTLHQPLVLHKPITLTGPREAIVRFEQDAKEEPWSHAILIEASNVTLNGFSLRLADDTRFSEDWRVSAAVIKCPNRGFGGGLRREGLIANVIISNLDIDCGNVTPSPDEKVAKPMADLIHMESATSGKILHNHWRGGIIDVNYGPWVIADNLYLGPPPRTSAWGTFASHWCHDITIERNTLAPQAPFGKNWRFFNMNQFGDRVIVRDNDVRDIGMKDDDKIPNPNAPEIIVTEAYRLLFEGKPAALSADGRVIQIPFTLWGDARPGTVVSIVSGEHAGEWYRIAQPLSATAYLMQRPMPQGDYIVSVAHGFTDCAFERNRIDDRGGHSAVVVLAGSHWNLRFTGNHLLGGGASLLVDCCATEFPRIWGWSHTPFFDAVFEGNVHEDSHSGTEIDMHSDEHYKSFSGRTYLTATYRNNTFRWTPEFLKGRKEPPGALHVGRRSFDHPGQMRITLEGNRLDAPAGYDTGDTRFVQYGTINGRVVHQERSRLPAVPAK